MTACLAERENTHIINFITIDFRLAELLSPTVFCKHRYFIRI